MEDSTHTVTSELYQEQDNSTSLLPRFENNVVSVYKFIVPQKCEIDEDGDLVVAKKSSNILKIEIEHSKSTTLKQVGEQLWRGAFLLADWIIFNSDLIASKKILELATGVGLTGIVSSIYAPVILTDIDSGNILKLIKTNVEKNKDISKHDVEVIELDFNKEFNNEIKDILPGVDLILAADVIYDDTLTVALIKTFINLFKLSSASCQIIMALEKRYVFTISDLECCAPCLEFFTDYINSNTDLKIELLSTDFPQYFDYDRVKELVLYKISSKK